MAGWMNGLVMGRQCDGRYVCTGGEKLRERVGALV